MDGNQSLFAAFPTVERSAAIQPVLHSLEYSIGFLEDQVADLESETIVAQPHGVTNHPLWTIGHLSYVLQLIGTVIGLEMSVGKDWADRYGPGSHPIADESVYEAKEEALAILRSNRDRLVETVARLDDDALDRPFPDPSYRDVFPSVRHALTQVLIGHTAFHIGQISVWRRAMGLKNIGRSYE